MTAGQNGVGHETWIYEAPFQSTPSSVHGAQVGDFAGKQCVARKFML